MTWYTGDALYDTLLLIGFAYATLVLVSSFFGHPRPDLILFRAPKGGKGKVRYKKKKSNYYKSE